MEKRPKDQLDTCGGTMLYASVGFMGCAAARRSLSWIGIYHRGERNAEASVFPLRRPPIVLSSPFFAPNSTADRHLSRGSILGRAFTEEERSYSAIRKLPLTDRERSRARARAQASAPRVRIATHRIALRLRSYTRSRL